MRPIRVLFAGKTWWNPREIMPDNPWDVKGLNSAHMGTDKNSFSKSQSFKEIFSLSNFGATDFRIQTESMYSEPCFQRIQIQNFIPIL